MSCAKNLNNKYCQKRVDTAKKYTIYALKTASKKSIEKTAEGTRDLIGNKIAAKIKGISKKPVK